MPLHENQWVLTLGCQLWHLGLLLQFPQCEQKGILTGFGEKVGFLNAPPPPTKGWRGFKNVSFFRFKCE